MSSEILAPNTDVATPTGHPKLLQIETPLTGFYEILHEEFFLES